MANSVQVTPNINIGASHEVLMFPTLTPEQIGAIARDGAERTVARGEVLIEVGDPVVPFFVVKTGKVQIIRPAMRGETLVAVHGPGNFSSARRWRSSVWKAATTSSASAGATSALAPLTPATSAMCS